ncbi:WD-40 repeat-containing protein [Cylindrospermum sp. NIES-4074]|nr:WD-40 repeat-containing protein [Cylindrospermum sp. NIES-4074]
MTDLQQNANEKALQQLAWAIEGSQGKFKLILAKCNYVSLRDRLIARLPEICKLQIRVLYVQESARNLYSAISEEVGDGVQAMMVVGLDSLPGLPQMLTFDNQVREEFRKNFPFPLVLWINDDVHKQLMELAPDLESWATTRNFAIAPAQLIDFLQETAKQLLHHHLKLTLEKSTEIKSAWQDLQTTGQILEPESQANFNFLLGFVAVSNHQLDSAISYYQQSLSYWQTVNNVKLQFKILSHITYCHYKQAKQLQKQNTPSVLPSPARGGAGGEVSLDWQATRKSLQQCLELLETAESPELGTYLIDNFGGIFRDLKEWRNLETLANNALSVHQAEGNKIKVAQDYGYLAEVALADKKWLDAKQLSEKALTILSSLPNQESDKPISLYYRSSSLLNLSQAHRNINQYQAAINNLETAREIGVTGNNAHFYIKILNNLQSLLFQQKQYLQAFDIKLQRRSIEQQYGLRAFIGAGWLNTIKLAFLDSLQATYVQENLALEIAASGRQLDVERLIERIARPDYKLIAIYGQSGVGKSSLVNAGLVPALKKKAIGIQDNLPVVMRVYTNWAEELGRLMVEALGERGGSVGRGGVWGVWGVV